MGSLSLRPPEVGVEGAGQVSGCEPGDINFGHLFLRARALRPREPGRGGGRPEHAHRLCCGRARSPGAGTRGGAKPGPLPPRAPMYAFYSLLIYIFYSLFRRDGGAGASADSRDPAQVSGGVRSTTCNPLPETQRVVQARAAQVARALTLGRRTVQGTLSLLRMQAETLVAQFPEGGRPASPQALPLLPP